MQIGHESQNHSSDNPICTEDAFLSVVGAASLSVSGQRVLQGKRKCLALLSYLALNREAGTTREHIAGLLWGDSPERQARASLRQALSDMRHALGPFKVQLLTFDHDVLILNHGSIRIDLIDLANDLEAGKVPDLLLSKPNLAEEILTGFDDLSQDYTSWLREFRARFQERLSRGLRDQYQSDVLPLKVRRAIAETATLLDPLNEEAHRIVMQLAAMEGDVGTALQTYAKLFDVLGERLGMEPSARTQDLAVKIKMGHFDDLEPEPVHEPQVAAVARPQDRERSAAPTVAILPLHSIGPDSVPDFFTKGIVEDTVCLLATLHEPRVISSNSTRDIRTGEQRSDDIARTLGADYFVSGMVRKADENFHLSVQLSDVRSGVVEWARIYNVTEKDLFDVQFDIAQSIAQKLVPSLRSAELRRARGSHPNDLSAYHLALVARDMVFRLDRTSIEEAEGLLNLAAQRDPDFVPTFLTMADLYSIRLGQGWSADRGNDRLLLEQALGKAINLNEESGRALAMLGHNFTILRRDYQQAQALFTRALAHSPNDAETLMWSSPTLSFTGEHQQAIKRAEDAISLSPNDPILFRYEHFLSIAHYAAGDFSSAAHWGMNSFQRNPHYTSNLRTTAASLAALGKSDDAEELARRAMEVDPEFRVNKILKKLSFQDQSIARRYIRHLLDAGLPD